jgi:hypothetical protein
VIGCELGGMASLKKEINERRRGGDVAIGTEESSQKEMRREASDGREVKKEKEGECQVNRREWR